MKRNIENLILAQLTELNAKVDEVRTETLPQMKIDIAILSQKNRTSSKLYAGLGSFMAVLVSMFLSHVKR